MQAVNGVFAQIINGPKQFVIPVFQRDYSWGTEQWDRMWSDALKAAQDEDALHFLGSFVYVDENVGAAFGRWLVIDGQQRLTTLTLLMIALRDHLLESGWSGSGLSAEQIDDLFLKNRYETGDRRYRLALRRRDNATLEALIDGKDVWEVTNNSEGVVAAYERFRFLLREPGVDPAGVFKGVHRLAVVDVRLQRPGDNPQVIFESLNSTGVDLAQSDLIRNYLLMGLGLEEQSRLYDDYWCKLEDVFREAGGGFEEFLRDYIALSRGSTTQTRANRVYTEFKDFWSAAGVGDTVERLEDMLKVGRYYAQFLRPALCDDMSVRSALSFARSGVFGTAHASLVSRLYDLRNRGVISDGQFGEAMTLLKSFLVRRAVLGLQTASYWNVFMSLARAIGEDAPFEMLKVELVREKGIYAFPSDEEFLSGIQERDLYHLRGCRHILDTLENHGHSDPSPVSEYSIEHIMPQSIGAVEAWQTMLGEKWEEDHRVWLHRLGNLTLVGYDKNAAMSNLSFGEKNSHPQGFDTSAVRLNGYVRKQDKWKVDQMEKRGSKLARRAVEIWPYPEADMGLVVGRNVEELRERSDERDSSSLRINEPVRELLGCLETSIGKLGESIPVIEHQSVCFYDGSGMFFAELLPMAYYVRLLLPMAFDQVDYQDGLARDANEWRWLTNVVHSDCGVVVDVGSAEQAEKAIRMIRQVYEGTEV